MSNKSNRIIIVDKGGAPIMKQRAPPPSKKSYSAEKLKRTLKPALPAWAKPKEQP